MQLEDLTGTNAIEDNQTEHKGRLDRESVLGWLKTVAGFANANGGSLYIGVEDKTHKLLGFDLNGADKERNFFNNQVNEHIVPRPPIKIVFLDYKIREQQRFIIKVIVGVSPIRPVIVNYKNIPAIFVRREGFTNGATYEEIREMSLKSSQAQFDTLPTDEMFKRENFNDLFSFYADHNDGKILSDKALRSLGFFDAKCNLAKGSLLFADAYTDAKTAMTCSVFSGITRGSERIVSINRFQGNITKAITFACEFIAQRMNHGILKLDNRRVDLPAYPPRAVLEAIVNAIAHRDYFLDGSQIQIDMFLDRLEISSPGSFYQGAPIEKTYDLSSIISKRRNELICGVLVACKVMEAAGTGFDKISEEYTLADETHRPYIFSASDHFTLVLPDLTYTKGIVAPAEAIDFAPIAQGSRYDRAILAFCLGLGHSVAEIARHLGISNSTYLRRKIIGQLVKQNYLLESKKENKIVYRTNPKFVRNM